MFSFKKSLILKISAVVFLVEFLVLTSLGLFYTELFSHQIDEYLESSIRLPGELMNRRVLRYETVADTDAMADILGDEFLEGLIVGEDGHIYFASDPDHVDKSIDDIPNVDSSLFANNSQKLIRTTEAGRPVIISITPLSAFEGAEPFFSCLHQSGSQQRPECQAPHNPSVHSRFGLLHHTDLTRHHRLLPPTRHSPAEQAHKKCRRPAKRQA